MTTLHLYTVAATVVALITTSFLLVSTYCHIKEAAMYREAFRITGEIKKANTPEDIRALSTTMLKFYTTYINYCTKSKVDFHYNNLVTHGSMKYRVLVAERDMYKSKVQEREKAIIESNRDLLSVWSELTSNKQTYGN